MLRNGKTGSPARTYSSDSGKFTASAQAPTFRPPMLRPFPSFEGSLGQGINPSDLLCSDFRRKKIQTFGTARQCSDVFIKRAPGRVTHLAGCTMGKLHLTRADGMSLTKKGKLVTWRPNESLAMPGSHIRHADVVICEFHVGGVKS